MSQVLSVAPRTDTPCRPWTSHYIGAVSANLKNSLYVTKETSIILFQLGAVDILTFSPLNVNWTLRSENASVSFCPKMPHTDVHCPT